MRFATLTAAICLILGMTVSNSAAQEKGQEERQQQARPAQQQRQAQPQQRQQHQQTQNTRPATQQARPAQQSTRASRAPQQQASPAKGQAQRNTGQSQARARQAQPGNNSGGHGRISDVHYRASFGSGHSFHVNRGDYERRRFQYGGYSFGFVDPWPAAWGYSDDVYVVYADGGYYMYDRIHPGLRISVNIF